MLFRSSHVPFTHLNTGERPFSFHPQIPEAPPAPIGRGGEGAGLDSPGARRWKLPSAAGCTTPGCGRGKGAEGGRACVRRGCWPRRRPARLPGRVPEAGGAVLGLGGARGRPGVETSPGQVPPGEIEEGTDWTVRPGRLLCPPPSLFNPPPLETPYSMLSPPSALSVSSILWWGVALRYLVLPHPFADPAPPLRSPKWGKTQPPAPGTLADRRAGARAGRPTSPRSWGPRGDPGRGEAAPSVASLAGSARPGSPLGGWEAGR